MICSYIRQTSQYSPFDYLDGPAQFNNVPKELTCYKNIVFLTNPTEEERELHVSSVGYEVADPTKALINRITPEHMIVHYIVDGSGTFNGLPIRRGDCAVAFRNQSHSFCTDPDDPLKFYWIIFRHPEAFRVSSLGLNKDQCVFPYCFERPMRRILEEMLHFQPGTQDPHCFYLGKFYELMAYHKQSVQAARQPTEQDTYSNYASLAKQMWEQTSYGLSVEDVAHSLGFSRKHFSLIFSLQTGMLPQQYILEQKMKLAQYRIRSGETDLKSISSQLGYADYPAFSRAFKARVGISPREYMLKVQNH